MSVISIDEKEMLEIEKIKAEVKKMSLKVDKITKNISKTDNEIHHMTFKEWAMVASFFTALGAVVAKLV